MRILPWRVAPGEAADPYRVWLSEIMLQQTTVKAVIPYFNKFLALWPRVEDLADAELDEVLTGWAGLGYYSRARNLHACARVVVERHGGRFPRREAELIELPGIGPYTAAAIAAIAFGERATPVDGNVERVVARLFAVREPLPLSKPAMRSLAETLTPLTRAGDFAQAMMDLGATICTPRSPSCLMCPLKSECTGRALGIRGATAGAHAKGERPMRFGIAFIALREDGTVLLRRRPDKGLLGGMMEVPSTEWVEMLPAARDAMRTAPVKGDWWKVPSTVRHVFTHFELELVVYRAVVPEETSLTFWADSARCRWVPRRKLDGEALPSVMKKVLAHGLQGDVSEVSGFLPSLPKRFNHHHASTRGWRSGSLPEAMALARRLRTRMQMTGGEALVQQLVLEGASHVFGIPGVQLDWAVEALRKAENSLQFVVPRHEQATSYMADGFARSSGKPGVCMVVPGPGVLNAAAGLATAYACNSPVFCIAGHIHSAGIGKGYGALHEIKDQGAVLEQVTKWHGMAQAPEDVPGLVREAWRQMLSGRPGPVAVEVPYNVLQAGSEIDLVKPDSAEELRLVPDERQIDRIATVLRGAERPVIYVGGGVIAAGASAALDALAVKLGAPVVMSENGRGALSDRHPLAFSTLSGRAILPAADFIIVVGSRFMETRGPFAAWNEPSQKYIYINADPDASREPRVAGMFINADAGLAMAGLAAGLSGGRQPWVSAARAAAIRDWAQAQIDAVEPQASFVRALRAAIPDDGFFVNELTQVGYFARVAYPVHAPRTYIGPGYQGTLGYGFPTGLGIAAANPGKVVVSITGDGGFGWTLQELATAARYRLGHITVVFADGHFANVRGLQREQFGQAYCAELHNPDFVALAAAFGVSGVKVRDAAGLGGALKDAIGAGGPHLIEVQVAEMPSPWGLLRLKAPGGAGGSGPAGGMPSPLSE